MVISAITANKLTLKLYLLYAVLMVFSEKCLILNSKLFLHLTNFCFLLAKTC